MRKHYKQYLAEFIGTAVLVFVTCLETVLTRDEGMVGSIATALCSGLTLAVLYYAFFNLKAYFNPAVTVSMLINGKTSVIVGLWQLFSQTLGAVCGILLVAPVGGWADLGGTTIQPTLAVTPFDGVLLALVIEFVITFILALAYLTEDKSRGIGGIIVGFASVGMTVFAFNFTGASANPARSLCTALLELIGGNVASISCVWIYLLAPILGGIFAGIVKRYIFKPPTAKIDRL